MVAFRAVAHRDVLTKIAPQISELTDAAVIVTMFAEILHAATRGSFPCGAAIQIISFGYGGERGKEQDALAFIEHFPARLPLAV